MKKTSNVQRPTPNVELKPVPRRQLWLFAAVVVVQIGMSFVQSDHFWKDAVHDAAGWLIALVFFVSYTVLQHRWQIEQEHGHE